MPVIDDCLSFQGLALQLSSLKPLLIFYIHMDLYTCTWFRLRWIQNKLFKGSLYHRCFYINDKNSAGFK